MSSFAVAGSFPERPTSRVPAEKRAVTTEEDKEIESALAELRAWQERGYPEDEIDYVDAPATKAEDWQDAERVAIRFRKRP